jgi:hypothetical protein
VSDALLFGLAVAAGLACPLHMWWSHRRGRQAACCPTRPAADGSDEMEILCARQRRLDGLIAERLRTGTSPDGARQTPS